LVAITYDPSSLGLSWGQRIFLQCGTQIVAKLLDEEQAVT